MSAANLDIVVEQGSTFQRQLYFNDNDIPTPAPIDISGWTFAAQIRRSYSDPTIQATFTPSFVTDGTDGLLLITLTALETAAIVVKAAKDYTRPVTKYIWDIEATFPDLSVARILQGEADISPEVTR